MVAASELVKKIPAKTLIKAHISPIKKTIKNIAVKSATPVVPSAHAKVSLSSNLKEIKPSMKEKVAVAADLQLPPLPPVKH